MTYCVSVCCENIIQNLFVPVKQLPPHTLVCVYNYYGWYLLKTYQGSINVFWIIYKLHLHLFFCPSLRMVIFCHSSAFVWKMEEGRLLYAKQQTISHNIFYSHQIYAFLAFDFCRFCVVFPFPPQRPMTSDFEGFSIPDFIYYIYFPILILEKHKVNNDKLKIANK